MEGKTHEELTQGLKAFLFQKLNIAGSDMVCLGIQWIDRVRLPPRAKVQNEVRHSATRLSEMSLLQRGVYLESK